MEKPFRILTLALLCVLVTAFLLLTSCASGGSGKTRTYMHYSPGFSGYYHRPWGYRPIYIGDREVDPDWGVDPDGGVDPDKGVDPDWGVDPDTPVAMPLPDLGMPDFGGADFDFGGFE